MSAITSKKSSTANIVTSSPGVLTAVIIGIMICLLGALFYYFRVRSESTDDKAKIAEMITWMGNNDGDVMINIYQDDKSLEMGYEPQDNPMKDVDRKSKQLMNVVI